MRKVACYCMTRNIYPMVRPSLNSLLKNSSVDHVYLIAEDDDVGFPLPDKVSVVNVADQTFFSKDGPNYGCYWTYMVMMRIALCHVLPEEEQVLSLDLDTIVAENIDDLWDTPINDFYCAGVREPAKSGSGLYVNGGVVLWNLEKMRDGMADRIIRELNTIRYDFPEQDVMNKFCRGQIYELSSSYNVTRYTTQTAYPRIYHFAATAGWYRFNPLVQLYKEMSE